MERWLEQASFKIPNFKLQGNFKFQNSKTRETSGLNLVVELGFVDRTANAAVLVAARPVLPLAPFANLVIEGEDDPGGGQVVRDARIS